MKKVGVYTVRGKVAHGTTERITLFDGKFDTGYRVKEIHVLPNTYSATADAAIICHTEDTSPGAPDFADNTQIAWASMAYDVNFGSPGGLNIVDPDNMIIEDLFITGYNNDSTRETNYLVVMEKYEFSDWQGAATMVRNRSQA